MLPLMLLSAAVAERLRRAVAETRGDNLLHRVGDILGAHDVIPVEHASSFVPTDAHRNTFRHARVHKIPYRTPTKIVQRQP